MTTWWWRTTPRATGRTLSRVCSRSKDSKASRRRRKNSFVMMRGDGRVLAGGKFGAWILGQGNIDVSVNGVKQLELETKTELASMPTLFWAGARIVTRDGKEIPLAQLPVKRVNVAVAKAPGQ